jgi:phosphatidate cytidylyltransferase
LESISPSKTVEGVLGGLIAATLAAGIGAWLIGLPAWHPLVIGPVVGLAAQAGDLAESMLKRAAGRKDSGTLIPGHGGILDRLDSFLFAAPVLVAYAMLVAGFRA